MSNIYICIYIYIYLPAVVITIPNIFPSNQALKANEEKQSNDMKFGIDEPLGLTSLVKYLTKNREGKTNTEMSLS